MGRFWQLGIALPAAAVAVVCMAAGMAGVVTNGLGLCVALFFAIVARAAAGIGRRKSQQAAALREVTDAGELARRTRYVEVDPAWRQDNAA